ncbi:MAG: DUF262 domain-containing protein [Planctomycetes bacterium]|nr:DUF262 domain-containing protein [Planctomycetota bacterium]
METQVRTPQLVFMQPQRLVVPLFQRPYVWNEENQWEPLWEDVTRLAGRLLDQSTPRPQPHFLGAVVLQQVAAQIGQMQERTIIDGQQRLTTLQLLLDALHAGLMAIGATQPAARIEPLVSNAAPYRSRPEDEFKVWPTNRDRAGFQAVMSAPPPVDHESLGHAGHRMVECHRYFTRRAREWLVAAGDDETAHRGAAIETVVRDLLQVVVIDLAADENAQEIFETLNARGAQLTAADLIKNFIFQRLLEAGADVEAAYEERWREFETAFWEKEISVGRVRYPRSSIFLNHWLVARTGKEIIAREVFEHFKRFADQDPTQAMPQLLDQVYRAAQVYRSFVTSASQSTGEIDRLGLFGYRTGVLESEVIKPLVLCLLDPELPRVPEAQLAKALDVVESWMVRRMLLRATTKNYNRIVAELVAQLRIEGRDVAGDRIEAYFASQTSDSSYWPDDNELRDELAELLAYRRLGRGRLRMVLEAIEDHLRGWRDGKRGLGEERVARGKYAIEHVMPRKWVKHWPLPPGADGDVERDRLVHQFGNLTLLTGKLNSKVSNGPWRGDGGKRAGLEGHDVLFLNRDLLRKAGDEWTDDAVRKRTRDLVEVILEVWPVPPGHSSSVTRARPGQRRKLQLLDLINGEALTPGMSLYPRPKKHADMVATLLPDGQIEIDGVAFGSPSDAARKLAGHPVNGWSFFLVDPVSRRSLRTVRREYLDAMAVDVDDDDDGDDSEDE